jgi:hypothetical protein
MIATKKTVSRRTVLRGLGASLALPLLDAMVPPLSALAKSAANPVRRLGVVYVPNGIVMNKWVPTGLGREFELPPTLLPLQPFREQLLVVGGLNSIPPKTELAEATGVHARASTRFLTGIPPKFTASGSQVEAGVSMDQVLARELGRHTQLASLELGLDSSESAGTCDLGFSCAYTNTIAWRSPTTPLPTEHNPRAVFERLFGATGTTSSSARLASAKRDRTILDSVSGKVAALQRDLGAGDRAKLGEFLEAVRDVERRIQKSEEQSSRGLPEVIQPAGIPGSFSEHARLMYDLQVLAYQCDLTRVITFMIGREFSGRTYAEIGVPDAHHPTSHHQGDVEKLAKLAKINAFHMTLFAEYLEKLRNTPDGDGSLLDHMIIVYGAGMSDSNSHSPEDLPVLLAGGGGGTLRGGRHLVYPSRTPLSNLHVSLLDKMGVPIDRFGDSNGTFSDLSDV